MTGRGRGKKPISELIDWDAVSAQDNDCKVQRGTMYFRWTDKNEK